MLPLCFMEKMLSHFNGIRQINMKPPDFSVIHTGKAVIEPAADIDTDRTGIFPEQLFHRFVKQDRPCDNALMGKELIQLFSVNIKFLIISTALSSCIRAVFLSVSFALIANGISAVS